MKNSYNFMIIGGGPGGSALAALLSAEGHSVCVAEKKSFPREVLCGEFLSTEVTSFLKREDIYNKFLKLNPVNINSFRLINSSQKELTSNLNFEAYALKRSGFDSLLLENAVNKGADVLIPAEVKSFTRVREKFLINVKTADEEYEITSDVLIGAYGRQNPVDKILKRSFSGKKTGYTGIKFHLNKKYFNHPPEGEIQIYLSDGIYCGINPVNEGDYTICFLNRIKNDSANPKEQIFSILNSNRTFKELFISGIEDIISDVKIYGTANIFFGNREKYKDGVYFTGDAAGVIAPLAGDGMGMAVQSSNLLWKHLNNYPSISDPENYIFEWNKLFRSRLRAAKLVQNILLSKAKSSAINIVSVFPGLIPYLISKTRGTFIS